MEIALIIIASICLVALVIVIVLLIRKRNTSPVTPLDMKELGSIQTRLDQLSKEMKNEIELSITKEMVKVLEQSNKSSETNNEKLERFQKNITESLNNRFDSLNTQMNEKLAEINKKVDDKLAEGFKSTTESMTQVRERLQAIDDAQKNIEALSKDVVSLKTVLEGNQSRGQYGEYQLSMVLHNVFGDTIGCYEEQYTIKKVKDGDDVRADAVVFMPEPNKMICIDSKFPFAAYSKLFETNDQNEKEELSKEFVAQVKHHITDIKNKYIVEGKTAPEAIMFIPNDGIFAYIHQNLENVIDYAREVKVILTSPSTLPSILFTINMVRIEVERSKNVREISNQLTKLGKDFMGFSKEWDSFSRQLETASRSREKLDHRVNRITNKFDAIKDNNATYDEIENISINSDGDNANE